MKLAAVLLFTVFSLFMCKDPYGDSAKTASVIADTIAQGYVTVRTLVNSDTITNTEAKSVADYLKFANDVDTTFETCIDVVHKQSKAGGFTTCAQVALAALDNPAELALLKVHDSNANQMISTIAQSVIGAVRVGLSNLGGA